jgi:hypothetical protein
MRSVLTLPKGHGDKDKPNVESKKGMSKGAKIGIGVGGAIAALIAISAAVYYSQPAPTNQDITPVLDNTQDTLPVDNNMSLEIAALNNPIPRGGTQHLRMAVATNDGVLGGVEITGNVFYAGEYEEPFRGTTNDDGIYEYQWQIGGNSNPGTFTVVATAEFDGETAEGRTTFEVTES